MADFAFQVEKEDHATRARVGRIRTAHGEIDTPCLIPVATCASVRALTSEDLLDLGVQAALANTYHLHLRPGDEVVARRGGLRGFMGLPLPFFTDSGGFQAFSLGQGKEQQINKLGTIFTGAAKAGKSRKGGSSLVKITDEGISFRSVYDGSDHFLSPRRSMEMQQNLGADAIMAFDECTSPLADYDYTSLAMERTHRWAIECKYSAKPSFTATSALLRTVSDGIDATESHA